MSFVFRCVACFLGTPAYRVSMPMCGPLVTVRLIPSLGLDFFYNERLRWDGVYMLSYVGPMVLVSWASGSNLS